MEASPSRLAMRPFVARTLSSWARSYSTMTTEVATFANGCFWGTENLYRKHFGGKGVHDVKVGFIGGDKSIRPTYRAVCTGRTGYAEAAQLTYDPSKVSYEELLVFFYRTHDPTQRDGQGPDLGTQYRSALFPHTPEQESTARKVTNDVQREHFDPRGTKIVTTIEPAPATDLYVATLTVASRPRTIIKTT